MNEETSPLGLDIVAISLDIDPQPARHYASKAEALTQLIDVDHLTTEALGFSNVPMAMWVDEEGTIVRGPESASVERSSLKDMEIDDSWPDRIKSQLSVAKAIPSNPDAYRAAVLDWAANGSESAFVLSESEIIGRQAPRDRDEAEAVAAFELGQFLFRKAGGGADGVAAAQAWWQRAHDLDPDNWTYKRQAWVLVTTGEGQPPDLMQGPNDVFTGNWLDDVIANGGGEAYSVPSNI